MNIVTVKTHRDRYLINGNMSVPNDTQNRHYAMVQEWINEGNTPAPEFTQLELDAQAASELNQANLTYLQATDHKFYVGYKPKATDDLVAIEALRDAARDAVRDYNALATA